MNLVIFDFCDTLVNFQTADSFCRYALEKKSKFLYLQLDTIFSKLKVYNFFSKFKLKNGFQKKFLLNGLKGISKSEMELIAKEFIEEVVEFRKNESVFKMFLNHIEKGDFVIINSGGYQPYLKIFADKYQVNKLYATNFYFENDLFSGKISGLDCLGDEKVKRMEKDNILEMKFNHISVYSDSVTDMPIFNLGMKKYAVISSKNTPSWCNNFEIININE